MTQYSCGESVDFTWSTRAICRGLDPDLFFSDLEDPAYKTHQKDAEAICRQCPVILQCAEHALETGEKHGTWGGRSSWGSTSRTESEKYIARLRLQLEYNRLVELPNSARKRKLIKQISAELAELKNLYGR